MTQAAFLEVDKAEAEELRRLLGEKALETRVMVEERYFGDTTLLTLVVENITTCLNLAAAALSLWGATRKQPISINGHEVDFAARDYTEQELRSLLSQ